VQDGDAHPPAPERADRPTATSVLFDTIWGDIAVKLPAFLSLFAVAFVVGYFYAIDICWFSLFSLTDQLVFTLRSLPIAVGATLLLLMFLKVSLDEAERNDRAEKLPSERKSIDTAKERPLRRVGSALWLIVVIGIACYMFYTKHIGTSVSFMFVTIGTIYFEFIVRFKRPPMRILYWSIKVTIICLIVGFLSGYSLINQETFIMYTPFINKQYISYTVSIHLKKTEDSPESELQGRLVFSGTNGVLIYNHDRDQVRLVKWDNIIEMCGMMPTKPEGCEKLPQWSH
jgi:hypothetical protein